MMMKKAALQGLFTHIPVDEDLKFSGEWVMHAMALDSVCGH
jgi:hypothetical protein